MTQLLIGIDCGTTALKGVLCEVEGREVARAQRPIPLLTPQPGWAEQNPDSVWQALCEVIAELLASAAGGQVIAIAIGAQAGSITPVAIKPNHVLQTLHPMLTFLDTRAADYPSKWKDSGWANEIRECTGWGLQVGQPLTTMAWLRDQRPSVFSAATHFIGPHDDLVYRLCGQLISNASCGAQMPLIDRRTGQWSEAIAQGVGLSTQRLPSLGQSGQAIGPLLPEVAQMLGLPREVLVVNGGQDHACEALALGLTEPGALMLATGTAWVITGIADTPEIGGIPPQMDLNAHVLPDRWTISTYMGGFGATVEWWLNAAPRNFAPRDVSINTDKYALLEQALDESPLGAAGLRFLPESQTRSASQFNQLKLSHTWADMTRAIVEGVAYEVGAMIDALRESHLPVDALYMLGGAARSRHWPQVLAEITGVPIYPCDNAYLGAFGAAMLAGMGANVYGSVREALVCVPTQTS